MPRPPGDRDHLSTQGRSGNVSTTGVLPSIERNKPRPSTTSRAGTPWPSAPDQTNLGTQWDEKQVIDPIPGNSHQFDFDVPILGAMAWATVRVRISGVAFSGEDLERTDFSMVGRCGESGDGYDDTDEGYWPIVFTSGLPVGDEFPPFGGQVTVLMRRGSTGYEGPPGVLSTCPVAVNVDHVGRFDLTGARVVAWAHSIVAARP